MEFFSPIFPNLFEDTTITCNFLKNHFCNASYIEINTFFATHSNKELGNFIFTPIYSILQEMDDGMDSFFKYEQMYTTNISEKVTVFEKYLLLKKVLLLKKLLCGRSACFEKVYVLNNHLF